MCVEREQRRQAKRKRNKDEEEQERCECCHNDKKNNCDWQARNACVCQHCQERQTGRQRDGQTGRETNRQTERQRGRLAERQKDRKRERQVDRPSRFSWCLWWQPLMLHLANCNERPCYPISINAIFISIITYLTMADILSTYCPMPIQRYLCKAKRVFNSINLKCELLLLYHIHAHITQVHKYKWINSIGNSIHCTISWGE